ncbi:MAG TPA: hypothetical protein DD426_09070 [Clostridiaceae bacterium]|nr:hypothetical protein [Clostridiaceae bacterium]
MERVSIQRCDEYDFPKVKDAVYRCLDGILRIKKDEIRGKKVLIKANLLKRDSPEDAVTTHPFVVEAIARYLMDIGCDVIVADSPGGPFNKNVLKAVYEKCGMKDAADRAGFMLNYDISYVTVHDDKAKMLRSMEIIKAVEDADFVVSAAKLKTHGMMTFTGAVKNLFGVVPGFTKAEYHLKMRNASNFAELLVDICDYVKPLFSVIDGVEGMEGNGPSAGEKRKVGLIMASKNPYALDAVAAHIIGINPKSVPTINASYNRGLLSGSVDDIEIEGIPLNDINIKPFELPNSIVSFYAKGKIPKSVENILINTFQPRPVFNYNVCISCGVCMRNCPASAIEMIDKKPHVSLDKCIRCFCCHELCPRKAVGIKRNWFYGRIFGNKKIYKA